MPGPAVEPGPGNIRKFVILSHGRSGSRVLCKGLSAHPRIHAYGELLGRNHPPVNGKAYTTEDDGAVFCRDTIYRQPNEYGKQVVGFKFFYFHARSTPNEYRAWQYLIGDEAVDVILLLRRNLLDSYISETRARRSGIWHVHNGDVKTERPGIRHVLDDQREVATHNEPIEIDVEACLKYLANITASIAWARESFSRHRLFEVYHSDLGNDLNGTLSQVFRFLGEEPVTVPVEFHRLTTVPHESGVKNYEALRRRLRFSIYRDFVVPPS